MLTKERNHETYYSNYFSKVPGQIPLKTIHVCQRDRSCVPQGFILGPLAMRLYVKIFYPDDIGQINESVVLNNYVSQWRYKSYYCDATYTEKLKEVIKYERNCK